MKIRLFILFLLLIRFSTAGVFDDRYPSVRATGMSNAYVAVANDVWAAYYNPAGLAQLENYEAGFTYQKPFNMSFFKNVFLSAAMPLPQKYGTMGVSFENFGVEYGGDWLSSEYTATLSHGFYLLNDIHSSLSFGYNLSYYYWKLAESVGGIDLGSAGTFGLSVGLQASLYTRTYIGVYVYNINTPKIGSETLHELPQRIVIGAAYRPFTGVTTSLTINRTVGYETQVEGGFEFYVIKYLNFRLGSSTQPNRFSAGFGLHYLGIQIDYAFRNHPVLAETHQFGIIYHFSK